MRKGFDCYIAFYSAVLVLQGKPSLAKQKREKISTQVLLVSITRETQKTVDDDSQLIAEVLFITHHFHHRCTPIFRNRQKVNIMLHS